MIWSCWVWIIWLKDEWKVVGATSKQGWNSLISFTSEAFFFLWATEQFACEKEWINGVALLSWATGANGSWSLFCTERWEWFAHGRSFLKSNESELLLSLFKKEQLNEERQEQFALGHKKGGKMWKNVKTKEKYVYFQQIPCFLRAFCPNHEQITDLFLF